MKYLLLSENTNFFLAWHTSVMTSYFFIVNFHFVASNAISCYDYGYYY